MSDTPATTPAPPVWGFKAMPCNRGGPWHLLTNGPAFVIRTTACGRGLRIGGLGVDTFKTDRPASLDGPVCPKCLKAFSEGTQDTAAGAR